MRIAGFLFLFLLLISCSEEETTAVPEIIEWVDADFYFKGQVKGEAKSFINGEQSYRINTADNSGDGFRTCKSILHKLYEDIGDESVILVHPNLIDLHSWDALYDFFKIGPQVFSEEQSRFQEGFVFVFWVASCDGGTCHNVYKTSYGPQNDSELILKHKVWVKNGSQKVIKLKFMLNCKLYKITGDLWGEVTDAEFVVYVR